MNAPVLRVFALVVVLFGVLVGFTSRWSVFEAQALRENPNNRRVLLEQLRIKRGVIRSHDGTVLARSRRRSDKTFRRRYPTGGLFAHAVGFSSITYGQAGLEQYYDDALSGRRTELVGVVDSLLSQHQEGDELRTTLDPKAQQVAYQGLAGREGAVVALDVRSGAIRVMAANPTYDPGRPKGGARFNHATQALLPPGSTFKAVTAAAALDTGRYQPDTLISGRNGQVISGAPLNNFGGEDYGDIDLTFALTHSVNTVFGQIGVDLGKKVMGEYMRRFGFFAKPPADYPAEQLAVSAEYRNGKVLPPRSRFIDVGRMAIGQDKLLVTPLQMATVAQTIGNGGVRMQPRLVAKVIDPDGRTLDEPVGEEARRVLSEDTAAKLTAMMKDVVREGTGTSAALEGVEVAGKTGTAELDVTNGINDLWFIGFTDRFAIAVAIERQRGTGGGTAAPIAKTVLEALGA